MCLYQGAVLMDLRGLRATNRGAIRELSLVLPRVDPARIVVLTDRNTDERLLIEAVEQAWAQMLSARSRRSVAAGIRFEASSYRDEMNLEVRGQSSIR